MSWACEHEPCHFPSDTRSRRAAGPRPRRVDARTLTLLATILGSSMAFVDGTVVTVALPAVGRSLDLSLAESQWIVLAYTLALASLYLVAGAVGDRIGLRRVFVAGVLVFIAASVLCGLAPGGSSLIAFRALQGVGAAFMTTASLALLRATFGGESGRAIGLWVAWSGISAVIGPLLGGIILEVASWRWIFFINVPIGVAAAWLAYAGRAPAGRPATVPTGHESVRRRFDVLGAGLLAAGLALITYSLVVWQESGLDDAWWLGGLGVGALAAAAVVEVRVTNPVLPFSLFRERNFAAANAVTLLVYGGLGGSTFYLVLYVQTVLDFSPLAASTTMIPISVMLLLLAGRFGALSDRHGPRLFLTLGPALMTLGMLLWLAVDDRARAWALVLGLLVFSLGLAITVAPITSTALAAAPARVAGVASAINNTAARVGGLAAVALLGLTVTLVFDSRSDGAPLEPLVQTTPEDLVDPAVAAFRAGLLVAAALTLAGAVIAGVWVSNDDAHEAGVT